MTNVTKMLLLGLSEPFVCELKIDRTATETPRQLVEGQSNPTGLRKGPTACILESTAYYLKRGNL